MQPDLMLVIGILLAMLSIPSMLSAFVEKRAPRASAITVLIAGGLIVLALNAQPGGYTLKQVPEAFIRIIAQVIN